MSGPGTDALEQRIGYVFKDRVLLTQALTHSSTGEKNYERLEFLGDRVLGLMIADFLYDKFPEEPEGHLAKRLAALVQGELLAKIARDIDLGRYIGFSDAERLSGSENDYLLSDVLEALIGALYKDAGMPQCRKLLEALWTDYFDTMKNPPQHPKTALQEWAQAQGLPLPVYKPGGQEGPDHAPVFEVILKVKGHPDMLAQGRTRQAAEKEAARLFMERIES